MNRFITPSGGPLILQTLLRWFDSEAGPDQVLEEKTNFVDWLRILPLAFLHVMCLGVIWVGWSPVAVVTAVFLYLLRMFAITGFYHRYFSHRSFKTSRNNWLLAIITLGEGWHNNHHHYAVSARQGFFWWEIDSTYCILRLMARLGIITDLRPVPKDIKRPVDNPSKGGRK